MPSSSDGVSKFNVIVLYLDALPHMAYATTIYARRPNIVLNSQRQAWKICVKTISSKSVGLLLTSGVFWKSSNIEKQKTH